VNRLFGAELLKLRKRRGLVWATLALVVGPVLLAYAVTLTLHAVDPAKYGPAGGRENFNSSIDVISLLGLVAAVIVGVTAGAGDLSAGVFRELVVTGRSRLALFGVRLPGGLAFLLPIAAVAFALAAVAATAFAGSEPAPGAGLIARQGGFLLLLLGFSFVTALGVASVLGSRGIAIGLLLGWHLAAAPILLSTGKLDFLLPNAALDRLQPALENGPAISAAAAAAILALWAAAAIAAGAWRTATREA
jgi:hypothetical protein